MLPVQFTQVRHEEGLLFLVSVGSFTHAPHEILQAIFGRGCWRRDELGAKKGWMVRLILDGLHRSGLNRSGHFFTAFLTTPCENGFRFLQGPSACRLVSWAPT